MQSLDAGFPAYAPPSNAKDPTLQNFTTNSINTVLPSYGRPGMVQNWDLEVQHQIAQDLILSLGYVGQHATRLNSGLAQINTINPKYNQLGAALQDLVDGSDGKGGPAILAQLGVTVPSWFVPGWGDASGNATIGNLLRPFPQFGQISTNCCLENLGQSTYNALQAKLERRFRNGLNLLASYTYSKTITDADGSYPFFSNLSSNVFGSQNPFNLRAEKAVSYQDVPHTFVLSYVYELPVGPGKKYLSHGVASKVLGGWQVGGVQRYQTGRRFSSMNSRPVFLETLGASILAQTIVTVYFPGSRYSSTTPHTGRPPWTALGTAVAPVVQALERSFKVQTHHPTPQATRL